MLAYVFWHWPDPAVAPESYEDRLIAFHQSLAARKPQGFHCSVVFQIDGAPWLGAGRRGYEDWYLVEGSFALDLLNEAAVSNARKEIHDQAARMAAGGTAGLYRLRRGAPTVAESRWATWFAKPAGTSYEEFYVQLQPWTDRPGVGLWGRQMTLGPTPEFCLLSPHRLELPASLAGLTIKLDMVAL
jgi:hypothetical protein